LGVLARGGIIAALSSPAGRVGSGGEGAVVSLGPPVKSACPELWSGDDLGSSASRLMVLDASRTIVCTWVCMHLLGVRCGKVA